MKTASYTEDGGIVITTLDSATGAVIGGEACTGTHPRLTEIINALETDGVTITPYVAPAEPVVDPKVTLAALYSELDRRDAQRRRYTRIGADTTQVDAKIAALDLQVSELIASGE